MATVERAEQHRTMETRPALLPDRVEGSGLVLRSWTTADVDVLGQAVGANLEHLRPWMPWAALEPLDRNTRIALLEGWARERAAGGDAVLGILRDGHVVGGIGLHRRRGPNGLEIGYWVDRAHCGAGIATDSARLLTSAAFALEDIHFVEIHHDRANHASRRVPEKLGYTLVSEDPSEVTAPGQVGINCTWRVLAEDWRGAR